ncbi:DUF7507 domain-containing protein, partial [Algoriphagus confluentis]|uniref:DUF7507 domain-containing protein n=1 Tax=Algoriphagus confluentis TaxID=1697556 RepID=UPI0030C6CE4E
DEEGDVIEYSLTVTNTGNVTLTDVTITDPLTGLDQNIGTLAPGESETITTTYTVTQQDVDRGSVINLATATGTDPDGGETEGTDEIEVTGEKNPAISIEKSTTTESFDQEGDVIEYSLTVTNTGNVTLTDVTITDPLTGLDQNIGTLAPGESETITTTYTVTQQDVDRGSVTNLATATGTDPDGGETGGSGSVVVEGEGNPSIDLTKTAGVETYTEVGQEIPYTLVVTNTGNETLTNVVVLDPLTGLVETIPNLDPGESVSIETTYVVTEGDISAGTITNTATATGNAADGQLVEDSASTLITVGILPGIQIEKSVDKTAVIAVGEVINYTLVVTNTGNSILEDVVVTDPLTGFEEEIPSIAPGESISFETTYTVTAEDFSEKEEIVNVAFVSAPNPGGGENLTDQDEVTTDLLCEGQTLVTGSLFTVIGREPLANVPVILIPKENTDGDTILVLTNSNGRYVFRDVNPGDYFIYVLDQVLLTSKGLRPVDGDTASITVQPCVYEDVDFRYAPSGSGPAFNLVLSGFVWYDLNGDGVQNEWYDANGDGEVTQNVISPGEPLNVFNWEWIDLNGDGSYLGPENEGELNKAGFGNPDGTNIQIKGPNEYEATATVGQFGFWRHELNKADPYGEYEVTLITDPVFDAVGLQLGASGLVKNLPDPSGRLADLEAERRLVCEITTPVVQFGTVSPNNLISFDFDYGLRCFLVEDEVNLAVEKTSFDIEIYEGDEFVYEVKLRNIDDTDASEVILIDDLPLNVSYLSSEIISNPSGAEVTLTVSGNRLTWNIPEFTAGAELVVEIRVRAGDPGLITNIAEVSASENDIDEQDNRADDVNEILPFRIPNVITPGTIDGDNDTFEILGLGKFVSNEIVIFNRWGDHVFETEDYQNDWNAPGQVAGTYFYVLKTIDREGRPHEFKGWIQVIK